jgi:hypothetical protein
VSSLSNEQRRLVAVINSATSVTSLRSIGNGRAPAASLRRLDFDRAGIVLTGQTVHHALEDMFRWMHRHHRGERLYKSVIARKLVKGRHSLRTSALITEFRVGASIADCVVVNGHAHVYEIKTELDDPSKLRKQIRDYQRAFGHITVVTHESLADRYLDLLDTPEVGVLALSTRGRLSTHRDAQLTTEHLEPRTMFASLRQREFIDVHARISGISPKYRPVELYARCLNFALEQDPAAYALEFERQLRSRRALLPDTLAEETFEPVLAQCATINPTALQAERIRRWLESEVN